MRPETIGRTAQHGTPASHKRGAPSLRPAVGSALAALIGIACAAGVCAQAYPVKPVRLIVPFAPGGGTDVIARLLAARMSESIGRQMLVDNRGGANGIIGTEIVARAPADGYTLLFVSSPHSVNPSMYPKLPYDTLHDFMPVSQVAASPYVLVVHASLPVRSVRELVALARARPGQVDYASGGSGSSAHLAAELFKDMARVDLREIPYKGAGPALAGVVAGQTALVFGNALTVEPYIRSGRIRALGIASPKRSASLPEVPTIAESGVPGYSADAILGMLAPARTSRSIIDFLNAEVHKSMRSPQMAESMKNMGVEVALTTPEEFGRLIESEIERWGRLVRKLKLRAE
jgi:tripartite-type tricarboxylate transporter receptor subunit TctC